MPHAVERLFDIQKASDGYVLTIDRGGTLIQHSSELQRCRVAATEPKLFIARCDALRDSAQQQTFKQLGRSR